MWEEIVRSYSENPRDVQSQPLNNRPGLWFYVYVEKGTLYVEQAKAHKPSSKLSMRRKLSRASQKCEMMFEFYRRRKNGETVSAEAGHKTVNQVYWYGVFADMGY